MTTVGDAVAFGRARLEAMGNEGRFDALRLLEETLGENAAWIFAHDDAVLAAETSARYVAAIGRRAAGEPVAYITGNAGFFGRSFIVSPDVLVPRPETEMLVELACEALRERGLAEARICDVGTGSGILALTLARELPNARVTAVDISSRALAVARRNALALGVVERVHFACGDAFTVLAADDVFDCIVANLPYIRAADLAGPPPGLRYEPMLALDGGSDGLDAYRTLVGELPARLARNGLALLEAGSDTTLPLAALVEVAFGAGSGACVHVHHDYAGHPRVVDIRR